MPAEPNLHEQAREAFQSGKIPRGGPDSIWRVPGVGARCVVCEKPVTKDQMEFELQFARDGASPDRDKYHFHIRCFAAWELERSKAPT